MELFVFLVCGMICLGGALGVVAFRNPVHNALSLVATLFGIAVLFIAQAADFLAAVQVVVYAGAIVVLFLFVIMLLGVDRAEAMESEAIAGQRPVAAAVGLGIAGLGLIVLLAGGDGITGQVASAGDRSSDRAQVDELADLLFTDYVFAFEITAALLTIAVVGAVMLTLTPVGADDSLIDDDEPIVPLGREGVIPPADGGTDKLPPAADDDALDARADGAEAGDGAAAEFVVDV